MIKSNVKCNIDSLNKNSLVKKKDEKKDEKIIYDILRTDE